MPNISDDFSQTRFAFLNTEADLATTFVQVAETELSIDPEHAARALAKAREALQVIRRALSNPLGMSSEQLELLAERCTTLEASIARVSSNPNYSK